MAGGVGGGRQDAAAGRAEGADRAGRGGGAIEQPAGQGAGDQPPDLVAVAPAVSGGGGDGPVQGCAAAGAAQADWVGESGGHRDCDAAHDAARRHALERAHVGQSAAGQPRDRASDLAGPQPAAASHEDVQVEPRPALRQQAAGRGRPLHESPREGVGAECRRKEPDPGPGSDAAHPALAAGAARTADPRLHAARHDDPVRGPQCPGGPRD